MLKNVTLLIALIALILIVFTLGLVAGKLSEIEAVDSKHCLDCNEVMHSIADSFEMNKLDYALHWRTPEGSYSSWGVSGTLTLEGGE